MNKVSGHIYTAADVDYVSCVVQSTRAGRSFPAISRKIYDIWNFICLEYVYKSDRIS